MVEARRGERLTLEALHERRLVGELLVQNLDGHRAVEGDLVRPVDGAHGPFADQCLDRVFTAQRRADEGFCCHVRHARAFSTSRLAATRKTSEPKEFRSTLFRSPALSIFPKESCKPLLHA